MKPISRIVASVWGAWMAASLAFASQGETNFPGMQVRTLDTPRAFPEIKSEGQWRERAREIREQILVSCGLWPMPEKTPLQARIFGKIVRDGYSVEKVYFQPYPGFYLAGNLYRPVGKGRGPFPAVLNPHGHWAAGRLTDTPECSIPARCLSFARQGMVAFAYDMVGYNDTHFADAPEGANFSNLHRSFATNRADLLWNISLMGLQTWNSIRALDFLASLPDVDPRRLACTGESGGGTQTFMLGAADDRLAVQAPVVMVSHTMQGGCLCENAPGLRVEYSNMEIAAAAAPRPQLLVAATGDWTKDTLTTEGPAIAGVYRLFGKADRLRYVRFDFGHNYNQTSREAVYDWFGKWLLSPPDPASLQEQPYKKEADADLRVFPDGKLPAGALTQAQFIASLKQLHQAQWDQLMPHNAASFAKFQQVIQPAWRHTLQVQWPRPASGEVWTFADAKGNERERKVELLQLSPETSRRVSDTLVLPGKNRRSAPIVILAGAGELAGRLIQAGIAMVTLPLPDSSTGPEPFRNFYTTYNCTELQRRVQDLVAACAHVKRDHAGQRVVVVGAGRNGLAATLAAPAADAVVADCDQLDVSSDEALLAPDLLCPGIRNIGTFEGAAMLAAPHPLLLHNTNGKFPTQSLRAAYHALGQDGRVRVESHRLTDDELVSWISRLK